MTVHARDFQFKGSNTKAEQAVERMNRGITERNYVLYQKGIEDLMESVKNSMPQLNHVVKRKLFVMDTVTRFLNEIQSNELGYREFPFETNIGIGQLFLNPTLEVRVRDTQDVIAVFESTKSYRLLGSKVKLERLQDRFIEAEERRQKVTKNYKEAEALLADPLLIFEPEFDFFLNQPIQDRGLVKALGAYVVRRNACAYYTSPEGEQALQGYMDAMQKELNGLRAFLSSYQAEVQALHEAEQDVHKYREAFVRLMNQYQVPVARSF